MNTKVSLHESRFGRMVPFRSLRSLKRSNPWKMVIFSTLSGELICSKNVMLRQIAHSSHVWKCGDSASVFLKKV
ncbi:hypothetical protein [Methanosarcina sp. Kolksee]|uniref:hypothetical protein n=1 Tax=Methanosarcina sp. Kolksee TaxID=1434099 RepID=UPI0012E0B195|nr:hypothetical protein [Methanosarcina sp. Kolksee]